jgi:menaquinol-cytochrome c reductase iron-sulfur subunit
MFSHHGTLGRTECQMLELPSNHRNDNSDPTQHIGASSGAGRRGFVAAVIGAVTFLFPFAAGIITFLNPLRPRHGSGGDGKPGRLIRLAAMAALPDDGVPRRFPVIADRKDAWTGHPREAIGAVYLRRRSGSDEVEAFSATCPHTGCFVAFNRDRGAYQCPCHGSVFKVDGQLESGPSPRGLDKLDAAARPSGDQKEIWVRYVDYYSGIKEKIPKS